MFEIHTIVCPVDFSPGSQVAIDHATTLATHREASVHLLHVLPIETYVSADGTILVTQAGIDEIMETFKNRLEAIAAPERERGRSIVTAVRMGSPAEEAVRYAEQVSADLVVVGTHGRTGLRRLFVGSVAERIVRICPVPVLTVRMARGASTEPDHG